jgi:hypothetical protein
MISKNILDDLRVSDAVSLTAKVIDQPGIQEMTGTGARPPTPLSGIVRHDDQLDIHDDRITYETSKGVSSPERSATPLPLPEANSLQPAKQT